MSFFSDTGFSVKISVCDAGVHSFRQVYGLLKYCKLHTEYNDVIFSILHWSELLLSNTEVVCML